MSAHLSRLQAAAPAHAEGLQHANPPARSHPSGQANLDICKGGAATFDKAAEPTEPLREGNFAASNIDQQSARGEPRTLPRTLSRTLPRTDALCGVRVQAALSSSGRARR